MDAIEIGDIVERNPHVDVELMNRALETLEELRNQGVRQREFEIESPFKQRRRPVESEDPRTVHISQ